MMVYKIEFYAYTYLYTLKKNRIKIGSRDGFVSKFFSLSGSEENFFGSSSEFFCRIRFPSSSTIRTDSTTVEPVNGSKSQSQLGPLLNPNSYLKPWRLRSWNLKSTKWCNYDVWINNYKYFTKWFKTSRTLLIHWTKYIEHIKIVF